jgi:DNA-binding GntR family transcriptional regulator
MKAPRTKPRSADRAGEIAYAHIKKKILDTVYAPGSQILEQTLSADVGLSRTPIREALVRLEQEGLLRIVPRHGVQILMLSADDMREIYDLLACLEPKAVELLAARKLSKATLRPLIEACDAMEEAIAIEDRMAWATADERFHLALVELCNNRRLAATVMSYWGQTHRVRMFTLMLRPLPVDSTREHRAVLNAILAGESRLARDLYEAHRLRSQTVLAEIINAYSLSHGLSRT